MQLPIEFMQELIRVEGGAVGRLVVAEEADHLRVVLVVLTVYCNRAETRTASDFTRQKI